MDELLFSSTEPSEIKRYKFLMEGKKIRKLAPRVYTTNFDIAPDEIIKRNIFRILNHVFPGSVLSHRSAFEIKPTDTNKLFLSYKYSRKIIYPGIEIVLLKGAGPLEDDIKIGPLCASSRHRAFLENLQKSRTIGGDSKTLPIKAIEHKLRNDLYLYGADGIKQMLFKAELLSIDLNMQQEYSKLAEMVIKLLSGKREQL